MTPTPAPPSPAQPDFSNPEKECDLVSRGGVTSGIIYPPAILKLAVHYRFRNIGGTSAGAIAAAAEYGRAKGQATLQHINQQLGSYLIPDPKTLKIDRSPSSKTCFNPPRHPTPV